MIFLQLEDHGIEGLGKLAHKINAVRKITRGNHLSLPGQMPEVSLEGLESSR